MKLTLNEYNNIIDSRLVDLENNVIAFKENNVINPDDANIKLISLIIKSANALLEAYEAKVNAEEETVAEDAEEKYKISFLGE